jgi:autotransporter translocation and assembly factor TamB
VSSRWPQDGTEVVLHVETREPVWVRRNDFAVTMTSDVYITLTKALEPTLRGELELRRGYVRLLGLSFDIERGRVLFTSDETIDPRLEITATRTTAAGAVVKLEVTGFVSAPELAFFVDGSPVTAGTALMAISGRGGGANADVSAQEQLASAAIGMTTGLLSLAARQEFGQWGAVARD